MLLKLLAIAVFAWFVLRAARNLIRAVARDHGIPEQNPGRTGGRAADRDTVVNRAANAESSSYGRPDAQDVEDVEDAKFRDI